MVAEIVRQAVDLKLESRWEVSLISGPEYCCACGRGMAILNSPKELMEQVKGLDTVAEMRQLMTPVFSQAAQNAENSRERRLFELLVSCRIEEPLTDEARALLDPA